MKKAHRKVLVFSTLLGVLSLTSALLMALAPAPIAPDAASSLFAVDAPTSFDPVFETRQPLQADHWKYIFIHHSHSSSGNAVSLGQGTAGGVGDHFVIGNGDGAEDGEVQISQRWVEQAAALPPPGANKIDAACISICLVGDFDAKIPTQTQLGRLNQLVAALQSRLHIDADNILLIDQPNAGAGSAGAAGIGRYFPKSAFRAKLLP